MWSVCVVGCHASTPGLFCVENKEVLFLDCSLVNQSFMVELFNLQLRLNV